MILLTTPTDGGVLYTLSVLVVVPERIQAFMQVLSEEQALVLESCVRVYESSVLTPWLHVPPEIPEETLVKLAELLARTLVKDVKQ